MLLLPTAVVAASVGTVLPWSHNAARGDESGLAVLFGDGVAEPATAGLLGGLIVMLVGTIAAQVRGSRVWPALVIMTGVVMLVCLGGYGHGIATQIVWSFGKDSAGNFIEWEDPTRLGTGWYLTATASVVLVTVAGLLAWRPMSALDRSPTRRNPTSRPTDS